ncbi:PREDICTED: N-acetylgalactosaminyltransferase 7 isoform X1 [Papilio xuthus]|uniref:Polypeptide N-acetylgalactosaminyltransferase n=2 Tax=Papilio xuthus TaxID=66420 RepID=A0A194PP64_PAPXU|nr:PREDICTED: N-acetylgalactosaminyltransferase 7 isoform X1 [Papilio xuthus]KPI92925.1 N-acetylgalactosaminyltransferase 7 [Papilio xuthus]
MRITNVRRGRIFRIAGICAILLVLIYALQSWTSANVGIDTSEFINSDAQKSYYKFHRNVYPALNTELGNFEPKTRNSVSGPGEEGKPYHMSQDRTNDISESESEYGMNIAASDDIAMNRSIPDTRLEECKYWHYPKDLPSTSVIIVFHNEGFSVLMRTVHSVIDRSPPSVLHEVVLVDDYSDKVNLKDNLDNYIKRWNGKVRLIRNTQREGLIRTRSRGAQEATGDVIVFLDAHCEVNVNWLPPLLAPIYRDYRIMTVPVIDGIDHRTFEYRPVYQHGTNYRGIFEWGMLYKENEVPDRESNLHKHKSEPYKSPTHAGGLFAINRRYFLEIGAYDPGLLVWGGENFELSFKIWQCGGSIEWVPCSRVGHVYRAFMPYSFGSLAKNRKGSLITINYKRVIETWFDEEHKEYFYTREPMARFLDMGDITDQLALKERLKCKSFGWFMENVAYDVYDKFPKLPKNVHWGMVKNKAAGVCLDTMGKAAPAYIGTSTCHGAGNNQLFRLNEAGQLAVGERCVEADSDSLKQAICRLGTVDGPWSYDEAHNQLVHRLHSHCLTLQPQSRVLGLAPCDPHNTFQQWTIAHKKPNW